MKRVMLMVACLFALGVCVEAADVTPAMKSDFLARVKSAVAQKDYTAFSALYCQKGTVDPAMKDQLDKFSHGLFTMVTAMPAPAYEFAAPAADHRSSFEHGGKTYVTNLDLVLLLQVHDPDAKQGTAAAGTWSFPLGVENGKLEIVQTVVK